MLGLREEPIQSVTANYCPFTPRVCQHWPFKSVQTRNPLAPILKALVDTAESVLETAVSSVAVSARDTEITSYSVTRKDIHTVLRELGIDGYNRLDHAARHLVLALGAHGNCSEPYILPEDPVYYYDPEHVVITTEYTRDSMTAGYWREDCGSMELLNHWTYS